MPSKRERLIEAIRETPDDDAPRLVMADWFAEQGDADSLARADFIRTQIGRARLPDDDERQSELQARELRLLRRWGAAWQGSHFGFRKSVFRRGFIEYAHLHLTHFLHHRRQLMALEPLRDIRLTGWHRADPGLVRRVAACEEWRHIETLRIHHQGPHKGPDGRILSLLESPHLTGLKALHGTQFSFSPDERRRFERLAIHHRLERIEWPMLDDELHERGGWFSDEEANGWGRIRSLMIPDFVNTPSLLRRFTTQPFWPRLEALELEVSAGVEEALTLIHERMPPGLIELRIKLAPQPLDGSIPPAFWARLADVPLRTLDLEWVPLPSEAFGGMLRSHRWCLEKLKLNNCGNGGDHATAIAGWTGARRLRHLYLAEGEFGEAVAEALFSSPWGESLSRLGLYLDEGNRAAVLALAGGEWPRLRSLTVGGLWVDDEALGQLIASPSASKLVWLSCGITGKAAVFTRARASSFASLPHLACLDFGAGSCESGSRELLDENVAVAWPMVGTDADVMDARYNRAILAPERRPALDGWVKWWWD